MKFIYAIKKYLPYAKETAISELKSQVAESHLGWLWWILDPLFFMLVYTFIVQYIFGVKINNFALFVFIGLIAWNFFASTVTSSVNLVRSYKSVFLKVYMPKYILIITQIIINFIKMLIGFSISVVVIMILKVNITINILSLIPILIVYILLTFGVSLFFTHFGVYVSDLQNVTAIVIRLLFYMSGVFYTLDRLPDGIKVIYTLICPTGFFLQQYRNVMMYGTNANYLVLLYWFIISIILIFFGLKLMNKYESTYIKVI